MSPLFADQVHKLLAEDQLEEVISLLQETDLLSDTTKEEILSLSGRLQQVRQQEWKGTISHPNAQLEWNKIREALIQIIQFYSKSPKERGRIARQIKRRWFIPLSLYLLITACLLWWLFQPQPYFRMEANLLVERVTFQYLEGPANFAQGKLESCFIQNFESVSLEEDRLLWDKVSEDHWNGSQDLTSKIILRADENIPGIGMHFGPVQLERLFPASGALLTINQTENDPSLIQMTIQQNEALRSEWNFQDSMDLEVEMVSVEGINGVLNFYAPTQIRVFSTEGRAKELKITSFPGTSHFDMQFQSGVELGGKNLLISEPSFYQPLEAIAVPTLLAGQIRIGQLDQKPVKNIEISEGEALDIDSEEPLTLQHINFEEKGIAIKFYGTVKKIETGRNHERRIPSRIEWLWHAHKWFVSAIMILFLGFVIVLILVLGKNQSRLINIKNGNNH